MPLRRTFHLPGMEHKSPIPSAAMVGDTLYSSGINGKDPATGSYPDDVREQARLAFDNMRQLVELAGGTVDNIVHVRVLLHDREDRTHVNPEWERMFPDSSDRPARHAELMTRSGGGAKIQLEMVAVIPGESGDG